MEQDEIHGLTAAYALDALDDAEASEYEAHLGRCETCQEELASLQGTAASLAYVPGAPAPPRALRSRILEEARRERAPVVPLRRRWAFPALAGATVVAASAAIALGVWATTLASSLADERAARADQERALAVLAEGNAAQIPLDGADGVLLVARTGDAALVVSNLRAAPDGKTYEAWVIAGGKPLAAGLFEGGAERTVVPLDRPVPDDAVVAVTVEDDGGAEAPTTEPLFTAEPA